VTICEACGQRILVREGVPLSPLKAELYDSIMHSGKNGIDAETLGWIHFPNSENKKRQVQCVKVHVGQLRDLLAGTRTTIECSKDGLYRMMRRK